MSVYLDVAVVAFVVAFVAALIYEKFKNPNAPTLDKVRIPGGGWIAVGILVVAVAMLAFLFMKNPLER